MRVETQEQRIERLDRQVEMLFNRTAWLEQELSKVNKKKHTNTEEKEI